MENNEKDSFEKFQNFKMHLSTISTEKAQNDKELRCWVFGRPLGLNQVSIFERILRTKGTRSLIELIWTKFDLSTKEEILGLVRKVQSKIFRFLKIFLNRKTAKGNI